MEKDGFDTKMVAFSVCEETTVKNNFDRSKLIFWDQK